MRGKKIQVKKQHLPRPSGPKVSCGNCGHHYSYHLTSDKATGLPDNLGISHSSTYSSQNWC